MKIQRGDQYSIPIELKFDGQILTPADCDDVRIQIGDKMLQYSDGELVYDAVAQVWMFPLTEEETRTMKGLLKFQQAVKIGTSLYYSDVTTIDIKDSIITEEWIV